MNPAILSLIALLIAIALSMASKLNVGVLAMAFAWLIGTYVAGWKVEQVAAGFVEVANASMYDGASAAAEAVLMAMRVHPKRRRVVLARSLHPDYRAVTHTYVQGAGDVELVEAPFGADGRVDLGWLGSHVVLNAAG